MKRVSLKVAYLGEDRPTLTVGKKVAKMRLAWGSRGSVGQFRPGALYIFRFLTRVLFRDLCPLEEAVVPQDLEAASFVPPWGSVDLRLVEMKVEG